MINDKNYYLDLFSVTEDSLRSLVDESLRSGGDYADLYFENTSCADLLLRDGEVSSGGFNIDYGVGIRVLKGEKTGYAYSESTDRASMLAAARAAALIADADASAGPVGRREDEASAPKYRGRPNPAADRYPMLQDWRSYETARLVPFLEKLHRDISEKDCRVIKVIAMLSSQVSDLLMYNSLGELKYETRPLGSISVSAASRPYAVSTVERLTARWRHRSRLEGSFSPGWIRPAWISATK